MIAPPPFQFLRFDTAWVDFACRLTDEIRPIRDIQEFQPNGGCNTESFRSTLPVTRAALKVHREAPHAFPRVEFTGLFGATLGYVLVKCFFELLSGRRIYVVPIVPVYVLSLRIKLVQIDWNIVSWCSSAFSDNDRGERRQSIVDTVECDMIENSV